MDLEILQFYTNALIQHRKAGKPDSDFLKKLSTIFLNDQIPSDVYEMLNTIVKKDSKPPVEEEKRTAHGKPKYTVKPATESPKAAAKVEMDHGKISTFLAKQTVYVEWSDGCHTSHRKASLSDILDGKQLYREKATPSTDPCRGPSFSYDRISTPDFTMQPVVSNTSGSCGSSSVSSQSGSCGGGSTSPSNGRC
jgi:hypothetical protein